VSGDDTGEVTRYLAPVGGDVLISDEPDRLLLTVRRERGRLGISRTSLSHALHDGVVPFPATIYDGVLALTLGDRVTLSAARGEVTLEPSVDFPYFAERSRRDETPDTGRLLELLADATARRIEGASNVLLLLSAGKDSSGLALALAECGRRDVLAVTYTSDRDDEAAFARRTADRLGFRHETVSLRDASSTAPDALDGLFERAPFPPVDPAQIPVLLTLRRYASDGAVVVEGTGNDASFGYVPRLKELRAVRFGLGRWSAADALKPLVSPWSGLNYALRDPVEVNWPALRPRHCDTRRFFQDVVNTSAVWRRVRRRLGPIDPIDARGLLRGRHFEIGSQRQKIDLAAGALGMRAVYPYQDERVASYYFNLPEPDRFDRARLVNKVLLRRLLRERLDYDEHAVGKRGFTFDGAAFLQRFSRHVLDEVACCSFVGPSAVDFTERALTASRTAPRAWHAAVALFQIAGWLNRAHTLRDA